MPLQALDAIQEEEGGEGLVVLRRCVVRFAFYFRAKNGRGTESRRFLYSTRTWKRDQRNPIRQGISLAFGLRLGHNRSDA